MDSNKFAVPLAIIIAGGLIAGALYFSNIKSAQVAKTPTTDTNTAPVGEFRKVSDIDHIQGSPSADLVIVEYSDTECPYCKTFHGTLNKIMNEYGAKGKVAWVYRHFPIDQLHPKARKEAEATECANELGGPKKFWEFINMVYDRTPSNNGLDPAELPKIATAVGLDVNAFNTCLASGKYASKVEADYQDAVKSGGRGTPHSVIIAKDGTKTPLEGAYPYEQLKMIIDTMLKK